MIHLNFKVKADELGLSRENLQNKWGKIIFSSDTLYNFAIKLCTSYERNLCSDCYRNGTRGMLRHI